MPLPEAFRAFRTCYQHPAGATGVALASWLVEADYARLTPPAPGTPDSRGGIPKMGAYTLTSSGVAALAELGVDTTALRSASAYQACADYTVRLPNGQRGVPHVGGKLGAALTAWLQQRGYAERLPTATTVYDRRTLRLTATGQTALEALEVGWCVRPT